MVQVLKTDGHGVGCEGSRLPDPAEMRLGTSASCGSCQAPFVAAFRNTPSGMHWVPAKPPPRPVQAALEIGCIDDSATVTYRIVLPGCPPSKNQFDNLPPAWKSGQKKSWVKRIIAACEEQNVPKGNAQIGLAALIVFPNRASRRDPQNYAQQIWHWVPDALVSGGYLVDDNEGRLSIGKDLGLKLAEDVRVGPKKAKGRTVIALTVRKAVPRAAD
jgi:hypothetical protein